MTLHELNTLDPTGCCYALATCNGSRTWIGKMETSRPFASKTALLDTAERIWYECHEQDWREAFTHHPRIGDLDSLKKKFPSTGQWAAGEQAGINQASEKILAALATDNKTYEDRFGYIFIVCATGRTAAEMLGLLQQRLHNDPQKELRIAMGEQYRITRLRLEKLLQ